MNAYVDAEVYLRRVFYDCARRVATEKTQRADERHCEKKLHY